MASIKWALANISITRRSLFAILLIVGAAATDAQAQEFPSQTIRIVVPYAPGGQADITARLIADGLKTRLSQSVIVENRPGANGSIGSALVAQAAPILLLLSWPRTCSAKR